MPITLLRHTVESTIVMKASFPQHLAIVACVLSITVLYMIVSGIDPTVEKANRHYPPLLWGYDPDTTETDCGDATDNDEDGLTDCFDVDDCSYSAYCSEDCDNGEDDDGDTAVDCDDAACSADPACT